MPNKVLPFVKPSQLAAIYKAMEQRNIAAHEALGLVSIIVLWGLLPDDLQRQAEVIVKRATDADKILAKED